MNIGIDEIPECWTASQKFEYWKKRADDLYATRHDPFQDDKEVEWYCNALERYISEYTRYYAAMISENVETLKLAEVMWLTYNPKDDITLKHALNAVQSFLKKEKITNYIYVIEQRGVSTASMGSFHIHIFHKHKYDRASHYKRETKSSFKKTCLVDSYSCLNMQPCMTDQDVKKRLKYILGEKRDDDGLNKHQKQLVDKEYRKKYLLKDYYTDDYTLWEKYMI